MELIFKLRLGASLSKVVGLSVCMSVCFQPKNKKKKVNETSTVARLAEEVLQWSTNSTPCVEVEQDWVN